jgi:perosamine synthetase
MILVNEPLLDGNEKKYVNEALDTGWISSDGPFVAKFEKEFAKYIGHEYGIATCNGTASLEVALYAANVQEGDEVILPSFTIISCMAAILRLKAIPVLVDIDPDTWCMDVGQLKAKITPRTKAIMPVHIYGHPVDMDPLMDLALKHNIIVVEDAAEVHGAQYKGKMCGGIGHISSFSFYPNKLITTGEGGMVLTSDPVMAERARSYRNLGFLKTERFLHEELGYNFRMTNLQAAIGYAQLEKIDRVVEFKREMGEYYISKLSQINGLKTQIEHSWAKTVYWMYCIELDPSLGIDAKFVRQKLAERKIETRPFFRGMHDQPVFQKMGLFKNEEYPITDHAYKYGLYLPSGMTITKDLIDYIVGQLKEIIENR